MHLSHCRSVPSGLVGEGGLVGWGWFDRLGWDGGGSMGDLVGFFFFFCRTVSSSKWTCLYTEYIFETILYLD